MTDCVPLDGRGFSDPLRRTVMRRVWPHAGETPAPAVSTHRRIDDRKATSPNRLKERTESRYTGTLLNRLMRRMSRIGLPRLCADCVCEGSGRKAKTRLHGNSGKNS